MELSLDLSLDICPTTISDVIVKVSELKECSEKVLKIGYYLKGLEEEMRKIEVFKTELPLCVLLLRDAILKLKEESEQFKELESENEAQEKEFVSLKMKYVGNEVILRNDCSDNKKNDSNADFRLVSGYSPENQIQQWNCRNGTGGFEKVNVEEDGESSDVPNLTLMTQISNSGSENSNLNGRKRIRDGSSSSSCRHTQMKLLLETQPQQKELRKQRRCWSPELHRRFIDALQRLGGSQVCRKCIYEKLSSEEVDSCPVCDVDLGCLPVEKLRPDHNLQDIRAKIFPLKKRKINPPEVSPSISLPVKRKERSLSSLVVSTPEVLMQTGLTGRRSRLNGRKSAALRGCSFGIEEPPKKEDYSGEDHLLSSSSPESSNKLARIKRQDSSLADPSKSPRRKQDADDGEFMEGKADLWTPLNCLVEAANRSKSSKSNSQGHTLFKSEPSSAPDSKLDTSETKGKPGSPRARDTVLYIPKTKNKGYGQKSKGNNKNNGTTSFASPMKRKRLCGANRNKAASSMEICPPSQGEHNGSTAKVCRRNNPIWFSLVSSADREGDTSLPQISACYLRIKDGQMPVSFIQKYLVKKLDLMTEAEVEITCRGRPVLPNMQLQSLVDLWVRSASTTKKIPALVGSTAKDFVMVLAYSRKPQIP